MDTAIYRSMHMVEDMHWWFVGRRRIVCELLGRSLEGPCVQRRILDAGCGTGGNLAMLANYGSVSGMESDPVAADLARRRGPWRIERGSLPADAPFDGELFDLIALTDVLEHLDEDAAALRSLSGRLAPRGLILITVPAFRFLWSGHDIAHHHRRRYTAQSLRRLIEGAGLHVEKISYFNTWLFAPIAAVRLLEKLTGKSGHEASLRLPAKSLNAFLTALFSSERFVLRHACLPIGLSVLALARKSDANQSYCRSPGDELDR